MYRHRFFLFILCSCSLFMWGACLTPTPTITGIDPRIGNPGDILIVRGKNFGNERGTSYLSIGGIIPTASSYIEWKDTYISVKIPEFAHSGLVYVHVGKKKSNPALFTNRLVMPQRMNLRTDQGGPFITEIQPSAERIGSLIRILGQGFGASRDKSQVLFSWQAELPPMLGKTASHYTTVPVSEGEGGYELWTDKEIRLRIPDGAVSGAVQVVTSNGTSQPFFFEVTDRPGTKTYRDKKTYAITYSVQINVKEASGPNTLYLWLPLPVTTAYQRPIQVLQRSQDPFVENYEGASLFQLKNLSRGSSSVVSLSYLVDTYTVETSVNASRVVSPGKQFEVFTRPTTLLPANNPEIQKKALSIVGKEKNPYKQAQRLYEWITSQGGVSEKSVSFDMLTALTLQRMDTYTAALSFCTMARSLGIPALPIAGVLIGKNRETRVHFWAEFWIDNFGWVPVDPALGAGAVPASFITRSDSGSYYFGNSDSNRIAFSRGERALSPMDPRGRIVQYSRSYALQSIWEESLEQLESYSSLWSDIEITGIY